MTQWFDISQAGSISSHHWLAAEIIVADTPHRASSRPLLQQIHWLPVEARIMYKLSTLTYRIFNGTATQYLTELCQLCSDDRLRSSSHQDYVVPPTYKRLADSSFSVAGPTAWNSLPVEFRRTSTYSSFCSRLKTFYFLSFVPSDISIYPLYFSSAYFIVRRPWTSDEGRHSNRLIIIIIIIFINGKTSQPNLSSAFLQKALLQTPDTLK